MSPCADPGLLRSPRISGEGASACKSGKNRIAEFAVVREKVGRVRWDSSSVRTLRRSWARWIHNGNPLLVKVIYAFYDFDKEGLQRLLSCTIHTVVDDDFSSQVSGVDSRQIYIESKIFLNFSKDLMIAVALKEKGIARLDRLKT